MKNCTFLNCIEQELIQSNYFSCDHSNLKGDSSYIYIFGDELLATFAAIDKYPYVQYFSVCIVRSSHQYYL